MEQITIKFKRKPNGMVTFIGRKEENIKMRIIADANDDAKLIDMIQLYTGMYARRMPSVPYSKIQLIIVFNNNAQAFIDQLADYAAQFGAVLHVPLMDKLDPLEHEWSH